MFSFSWKLTKTLIVILLIVTNILTLSNSKVHDTLYSILDKMPLAEYRKNSPTNRNKKLQKKVDKQQKLISQVKSTSSKISRRVARGAKVNLVSIPTESVPILGISTLIAVTAMDLNDACETMKDLDDLVLDIDGDVSSINTNKVCGLEVPTLEEVKKQIKEDYEEFEEILGGTIYEILH